MYPVYLSHSDTMLHCNGPQIRAYVCFVTYCNYELVVFLSEPAHDCLEPDHVLFLWHS